MAIVAVALVTMGAAPTVSEWTPVGGTQDANISGFALVDRTTAGLRMLIAHDNKRPREPRLAMMTIGSATDYSVVAWPAGFALPIDLEAISRIPGYPDRFLALTSGGTATVLSLTGRQAEIRGAFTVPDRPGIPNFEGLSVQRLNGALVVAWGQRGAGEEPGRLFWGRFRVEPPGVTDVRAVDVSVPYPMESHATTRHISDLRIDTAGTVWISAASDPGDAGPFTSAVYALGRFRADGSAIALDRSTTLTPLLTFPRKIEAIEFTGDGSQLALGTDDEEDGSAVALFQP